jgi:4'-phosphopantetheinyl transferase EntD
VSTGSHYSPNTPQLSQALQALFPTGVTVAEMRGPGDVCQLLPGEADTLARAVPKRIGEFVAGRLCARRAMAEFGVRDFALKVRQDRTPDWPETVVGSISHTAGLYLAAVADKSQVAAVGIDCEVVGHVGTDIWSTICGTVESDWVDSLPVAERPAAVTLIFAAKEAFYKCQYPLTGEWLDFKDLRVRVDEWGPSRSLYEIRECRPLAVAKLVTLPVTGAYLFQDGFVTAGVAMLRTDLASAR